MIYFVLIDEGELLMDDDGGKKNMVSPVY